MNNQIAEAIALRALVWILQDDDRAQRLLSVTGITPEDMRGSIGEAWLLGAALSYLEGYEPDLLKCCAEIDVKPEDLVMASRVLDGIMNKDFDEETY